MPKSLAAPSLEDDGLLARLRRHLDRARGFSLVFLFVADEGVATEFRARVEWLLRYRTRKLECVEGLTLAAQDAVISGWLAADHQPASRSAIWFDLVRRPAGSGESQASFDSARGGWLALLNEQRSRLELGLSRALLIVLPEAWRAQIWRAAPDLWTVRSLVGYLAAKTATKDSEAPELSREGIEQALPADAREAAVHRIDAWRSLAQAARQYPEQVSPLTGWQAVDAALSMGNPDLAAAMAREVLALSRDRLAKEPQSTEALRDLFVSLNNLGYAAWEMGRREEREAAYRESLGIARRLVSTLGETPQALRDLSVSLERIGDATWEMGRREEGEAAWRESLGIRRRLVSTLGETPQALRDLSVSLNKLGHGAWELGRREEGEAAWRESLGIDRRLVSTLGETPEALRDLSVSLNKLGYAAWELGRFEEGEAAYRESLDIARRLVSTLGETPQALRDLTFSLVGLARMLENKGQPDEAQALKAESATLAARLEAMKASGLG